MFLHCNLRFKAYDIWFLDSNDLFENRKLYLGKCPLCNKQLVELKETRKTDGRVFKQEAQGQAAENLMQKCSIHVKTSAKEIRQKKCKMTLPRYLRSGENIIVTIGGKTYQRMNAVSRWGQKEIIEDIPITK